MLNLHTLQARALAAAEAKKQADVARRSVTLRGRWGSVIAAAKQAKEAEAVPKVRAPKLRITVSISQAARVCICI